MTDAEIRTKSVLLMKVKGAIEDYMNALWQDAVWLEPKKATLESIRAELNIDSLARNIVEAIQ